LFIIPKLIFKQILHVTVAPFINRSLDSLIIFLASYTYIHIVDLTIKLSLFKSIALCLTSGQYFDKKSMSRSTVMCGCIDSQNTTTFAKNYYCYVYAFFTHEILPILKNILPSCWICLSKCKDFISLKEHAVLKWMMSWLYLISIVKHVVTFVLSICLNFSLKVLYRQCFKAPRVHFYSQACKIWKKYLFCKLGHK